MVWETTISAEITDIHYLDGPDSFIANILAKMKPQKYGAIIKFFREVELKRRCVGWIMDIVNAIFIWSAWKLADYLKISYNTKVRTDESLNWNQTIGFGNFKLAPLRSDFSIVRFQSDRCLGQRGVIPNVIRAGDWDWKTFVKERRGNHGGSFCITSLCCGHKNLIT